MIKRKAIGNAARLLVPALLSLLLVLPLLTAGCGGGAPTPEQAVEDFYQAVQDGDWNAYLGAILPENVRRMTESDVQDTREQFENSDYEYKDLKYKTIPDERDKDKAKVELTSGTIVGTNPMTNQKESTSVEEIKKTYNITPSIDARRFKGSWYVDVPMASVDKEAQQQ